MTHLTSIKSDIKQRNIAITPFFKALRLAVASQHSSLSTAGFSALGHLLKRLYIQEHNHAVATQARHIYPLLLERLGDHRERTSTRSPSLHQSLASRTDRGRASGSSGDSTSGEESSCQRNEHVLAL